MSRLKGTPKTGGRKIGTPNKISVTLKDFLSNLLVKNTKQIEKDLKELTPKDRLLMLEKFLQYVIPKQKEIEINGEMETKPTKQEIESKIFLDNLPNDVIFEIADILQDAESKRKQELALK